MNLLRNIFIALIALAIVQILIYYPQMPDVVASHFDGSGTPNGWAGKAGFFWLYGIILVLLVIIFLYVPIWSEKRKNFGMNLPNRDYWLAPGQRAQTLSFFKRQMMIMGIVHLALSLFIVQLVIDANFDTSPVLDGSIFLVLFIYFFFLAAWLIHFFLRFRKPVRLSLPKDP